ncbi:MAG: 4-hydroxy-tetrahydrodipicolinate synthase [Candidatus Glassbacteria bacterium]
MIRGSIVALITPFNSMGSLDIQLLRDLINFHMKSGTDGILVSGTTGESPTLTPQERRALLEVAVEECGGETTVIAGCGTNSTVKAIELTREALEIGATAGLSVCPYYNKPTQEGLYKHFMEIGDVGLPIVLYNVPGRTCVNMSPETVRRLSLHDNIVAIKEASGDIGQIKEILNTSRRGFSVLSGDDSLTFDVLKHGGSGVISVTANLLPGKVKEVIGKAIDGDWEAAGKLHDHLLPLHRGMFIETNPIPVKEALNLIGWSVGVPRLPLTKISKDGLTSLKRILSEYEADIDKEHSPFLRQSAVKGRDV